MKLPIPNGYHIVGVYGRNGNYVYLKKGNEGVATPFCRNDPTFNQLVVKPKPGGGSNEVK